MDGGERIIVVDDDASVATAIVDYLDRNGYRTQIAGGGAELDALLREGAADLIVLDVMIPGEDGLAICRRLSVRGLKILMVSARTDPVDRVLGLEIGADDYLTKPFEPRELLARVRALLRRGDNISASATPLYLFSGWRYDQAQRRLVDPGGREIALRPSEHLLLTAFLERPARILERGQLIDITRGPHSDAFDRSVDLAVSRLRRKLDDEAGSLIETVRGGGYRFAKPVRRA